MNKTRTVKNSLHSDYKNRPSSRKQELPIKRQRSRSSTPLSRTSTKKQLERLKFSLDIDARNKKVEEVRKKYAEKKIILTDDIFEKESKYEKQGGKFIDDDDDIKSKVFEVSKNTMSNELKNSRDYKGTKSYRGTPEFKVNLEEKKNRCEEQKCIRSKFPNQLLREYKFFASPERNNKSMFVSKLLDSRCSRSEIKQALKDIMFKK
ncbi:hypothetical protein SteCoe_25959 [Stentor coeruleus]|uniref:Uncharacterized protein n=1 Tax=Stentor coeruleus TaxID=5963 RepID=A0A1R2BE71_9CILI|nr:hypothetical protein SteCoe_25959 [Stentor coeruleus]